MVHYGWFVENILGKKGRSRFEIGACPKESRKGQNTYIINAVHINMYACVKEG